MATFEEFLARFKKQFEDDKPQVDYATHKVTLNELNNIAYLNMKANAGWGMRQVDFEVVLQMAVSQNGGKPITTMKEVDEMFIPELAEYIHSHLMGKPEEILVDQIVQVAKVIRDHLFSMSEEVRNDVTTKAVFVRDDN